MYSYMYPDLPFMSGGATTSTGHIKSQVYQYRGLHEIIKVNGSYL